MMRVSEHNSLSQMHVSETVEMVPSWDRKWTGQVIAEGLTMHHSNGHHTQLKEQHPETAVRQHTLSTQWSRQTSAQVNVTVADRAQWVLTPV